MPSINSLMGSSSANSIYGSRNANIISGLASGLDTESMIQGLVDSYQQKITKLTQNRTKLLWQQEAYQSVSNKLVEFYRLQQQHHPAQERGPAGQGCPLYHQRRRQSEYRCGGERWEAHCYRRGHGRRDPYEQAGGNH